MATPFHRKVATPFHTYSHHLWTLTESLVWRSSPLIYLLHIIRLTSAQNYKLSSVQFSSVQSLSHVQLLATPWNEAHQASLSINSQSLLKLMPIVLVTISTSIVPFSSCLQSFPASGTFSMSQFFILGGQSIGVSASATVLNIQDWFPLGLTGWISLQFKGLSRVFTVQKHQFFNSHSVSHSVVSDSLQSHGL